MEAGAELINHRGKDAVDETFNQLETDEEIEVELEMLRKKTRDKSGNPV